MRYAEQMKNIALMLEIKHNMNVLQCVYNESNAELSKNEIEALKRAHKRKIDLSDAVYIVDIENYIGESVRKEIAYAKKQGKEIIFHSQFLG